MLYRFKSKAGGDVVLLETNGQEILRIIGKDTKVNGILTPEHFDAALQALDDAIHKQEAEGRGIESTTERITQESRRIHLRQRAWPLIALIQSSARMNTPVVWEI
jgi:hypothetical protein